MSDQRNARILNIVGLLLLLLISGFAYSFWKKADNTSMENSRLSAEMQGLELEKSMIERSLDSLNMAYLNVSSENEDLRGREASSSELIAQKDAAIKKIKKQGRRDLESLRKQVDELRKIKIEYETIIATLRGQNEQLQAENKQLSGENQQLRGENTELNGQKQTLAKQLEAQIRLTQSAKFKATSFRVEVARKTNKLTVKAKKAREIYVSFDLTEVPEAYRGTQHLFLVITDDKGRPVLSDNPTKAIVQAPTGPVTIIAQQTKQVSLNETQRMSFSYNPDDRLPSGNYVVAIYCDSGLLGASSFRLI